MYALPGLSSGSWRSPYSPSGSPPSSHQTHFRLESIPNSIHHLVVPAHNLALTPSFCHHCLRHYLGVGAARGPVGRANDMEVDGYFLQSLS